MSGEFSRAATSWQAGGFAIGTFAAGGDPFPGLILGDTVYDTRAVIPAVQSTAGLLADWNANLDRLQVAVGDAQALSILPHWPLEQLQVLPPVDPVGTIFAAGVNYREHIVQMSVAHKLGRPGATDDELRAEAAAENDERSRRGDPYIWTGIPSAVCGAYDDLLLPDVGEQIDWELELAVVIGARAHRVAAEDAFDYVAGYTIVNDITSRTLVPRTDIANIGTDWFRAKNQPTFFPTGPFLVPSRFVTDPRSLRIRLSLNGQIMQDATADDLLFDIPSLLAYASSVAILRPGDILLTGSPAGNGSHFGRFLRAGDVMEGSITGLGTQRTAVRAASGQLPPWQSSRQSLEDDRAVTMSSDGSRT